MKEVQEARRIKMLHQPSKVYISSSLDCFSSFFLIRKNFFY